MSSEARHIIRRVGLVLLVIGVFSAGASVILFLAKINSGFYIDFTPIVMGIFLMRLNLMAIAIISWIVAMSISAACVVLGSLVFLGPVNILIARVHNDPYSFGVSFFVVVFYLGLYIWATKELCREPVRAARLANGHRVGSLVMPAMVGGIAAGGICLFLFFTLTGATAKHAIELASSQMGPDYSYTVTSLQTAHRSDRTDIHAVVTAVQNYEIQEIPVAWEDSN